jgi:hypothetical protein
VGNLAMLALGFSLRFVRDYVLAVIYLGLVGTLLATIVGIRKSYGLRMRIQQTLRTGFQALIAGTTPLYSTPVLSRAAWLAFLAIFAATFLCFPAMVSGLDKLQGAGFLAAAVLGAILYLARQSWFDLYVRIAAYFVMFFAVIIQANTGGSSPLVGQAAQILFVGLGIAYSSYVVLSRERLLLDGMDILLIAIAVLALFTPSTEAYPAAQVVLTKTLLGGLCINLVMNKVQTFRGPFALLCLAIYLAIFIRSMV